MSLVPASIRFKNPGAMWGTSLALKWGAGKAVVLHDGLGQRNNIAPFPTFVQGAAAQIDLWHTSVHYHNKTLSQAIETWSGGNSWQGYVTYLCHKVPGLKPSTVINDAFLESPSGLLMMEAQAENEAGRVYPMTPAEWKQAQDMVFHGAAAPAAPVPGPAPEPLIRIGDAGASVLEMQKLLGCEVTGTYKAGSPTEFALKLFQSKNGLTPDGACGDLTWAKLKPAASAVA